MSTLRESLDRLLDLQKADRDRDKIVRALRDLDNGQAVQAEAAAAYEASTAATSALHKQQGDLKDAELELSAIEKKIKVFEQKMQGGQVTNTRELVNIEKEISQLMRLRSGLDDKILTFMDGLDSFQVAAAHADAHAKEREQFRDASLAELREKRRLLDIQLASATQTRQDALAKVDDKALLAKYEALRAKPANGGVAVAHAEENTCGGCHMQAASQDIYRAKMAEEIVICPNCGRIMA